MFRYLLHPMHQPFITLSRISYSEKHSHLMCRDASRHRVYDELPKMPSRESTTASSEDFSSRCGAEEVVVLRDKSLLTANHREFSQISSVFSPAWRENSRCEPSREKEGQDTCSSPQTRDKMAC